MTLLSDDQVSGSTPEGSDHYAQAHLPFGFLVALPILNAHTRRRWAMKELLEVIAKALVDHPEEVQVRSVEGQAVIILELRVHPEDVGQVIGHHGRIAIALRTIFGAAGMRRHMRVTVEILV
jgi:predicted RNA-binding protein YlqC (UPF0109 family)